MSRLFLTSSLAGTEKFVEKFLENQNSKTIVFIPTASVVEDYTGYVDEAKAVFTALGYRVIELDIEKISKVKAEEILNQNSIVYISGGNSFYLLQELKKKGLDSFIKNKVLEDKLIYIGESAGAIITSKNIDYSSLMDEKEKANELVDSSALSLVDFYVVPHYKEFPFEESADKILDVYGLELNLKPINNHEAIVIDGDQTITYNL
jgi:dipeptidase E